MNQATCDEINFIKTLGSHTTNGGRLEKSDLVLDYIQALPLRKNWGEIDSGIIVSFAVKYYNYLMALEVEKPKPRIQQDSVQPDLSLASHLHMAPTPSLASLLA